MLARRAHRLAVASLIVGTVAASAEIAVAVAAWSWAATGDGSGESVARLPAARSPGGGVAEPASCEVLDGPLDQVA